MTGADAVPVALGRLAEDAVGPDDSDHAGDVAPKAERDLQGAVGVPKEVHVGDAHLGSSLPLLVLADLSQLNGIDARDGASC